MEVKMAVFKGSAVAIVTPFKEADESVNYEAFADIIDYQSTTGQMRSSCAAPREKRRL